MPAETVLPAVPCGNCLHDPVCALKRELPADPAQLAQPHVIGPGLRLVFSAARVQCDHHLAAPPRLLEPSTPPVDVSAFPPRASAAEMAQTSRERGARANGERARKFTDEQLLEAVRGAAGNMSEAGRRLGVSQGAVRLRLQRLGDAVPDDVAALVPSLRKAQVRA